MKLKEVTELITDYVANGSFESLRKNAYYVTDNSKFARVIRLTDHNSLYDENKAIYVDKNGYEFLSKSKLFGNEIIIANVGEYLGTTFIVPKLSVPMTLGPNSILIKPNSNVLNKYLYYYFISDRGKNNLMSLVSGSAIPKFNKTDLRELYLELHPMHEQQHIVNIIIYFLNSLLIFF